MKPTISYPVSLSVEDGTNFQVWGTAAPNAVVKVLVEDLTHPLTASPAINTTVANGGGNWATTFNVAAKGFQSGDEVRVDAWDLADEALAYPVYIA